MGPSSFDQQRFADTFWATVVFAIIAITWLVMDHRGEGQTLRRWQRLSIWIRDYYFRIRDHYFMSLGEVGTDDDDEVQNTAKTQRSEPRTEPQNQPEPALQSRTMLRPGSFVLEPEELAGVARMVLHKCNAERPTKASIIEAGFSVKKGDSAKYKRASLIYDTLFVLPEPPKKFPPLTTDQELCMANLGLSR